MSDQPSGTGTERAGHDPAQASAPARLARFVPALSWGRASAVLVYSTITALHPKDTPTYTALAAGLIILTGVLFLASGIFRLGFITQFLSRPVMEGFVFGLAIFVAVGQLPKLFGLAKGPGDTIRQLVHLLGHLGNASWVTFAVGAVALGLLFALDRVPRVPGGLVVLPGLVIGVILSILLLVYRASRPTFSVLGADRDTPGAYEDIKRHPGAQPVPGVLIIRPDVPLFYANAQPFRDTVTQQLHSPPETIHTLILDLDANDELDITSSEALGKLLDQLGDRHVRVGLAHVHSTTAEMMRRSGILEKVGADHIFPNLETAVTWAGTAVGT
jgi:MFS superfamily sulfate permease-like transporter